MLVKDGMEVPVIILSRTVGEAASEAQPAAGGSMGARWNRAKMFDSMRTSFKARAKQMDFSFATTWLNIEMSIIAAFKIDGRIAWCDECVHAVSWLSIKGGLIEESPEHGANQGMQTSSLRGHRAFAIAWLLYQP